VDGGQTIVPEISFVRAAAGTATATEGRSLIYLNDRKEIPRDNTRQFREPGKNIWTFITYVRSVCIYIYVRLYLVLGRGRKRRAVFIIIRGERKTKVGPGDRVTTTPPAFYFVSRTCIYNVTLRTGACAPGKGRCFLLLWSRRGGGGLCRVRSRVVSSLSGDKQPSKQREITGYCVRGVTAGRTTRARVVRCVCVCCWWLVVARGRDKSNFQVYRRFVLADEQFLGKRPKTEKNLSSLFYRVYLCA